jgi:FkbM family methyltransferase
MNGRESKIKTASIGNYKVDLHLRYRHEARHAKAPLDCIDYYIAKRFIRPNNKVLDLGANIGITALYYIACGAGHVEAIEPNPELAERIAKIECDGRITVKALAVSDSDCIKTLYLSDSHNQGHSINPEWKKIFRSVFTRNRKIQIPAQKIDTLYPGDEVFDFIKIDVEGSEGSVVEGGDKFFKRNHDSLVQVEIFHDMFESVSPKFRKYFKFCKRLIVNGENKVILLDPKDPTISQFKSSRTAPNYLFYNTEYID